MNTQSVTAASNAELTDVLNVAKIVRVSGFSRRTIKAAIDKGEMKSFSYARQICVLRTEYHRWIESLADTEAA